MCFDCAVLIIRVLRNGNAVTKEVKGNGICPYHKCCTVVPFEMHLIANRKEEGESQQCKRLKHFSRLR